MSYKCGVARKRVLPEFHAVRYAQTVEPLIFPLPTPCQDCKKKPRSENRGFLEEKRTPAPLWIKNEIWAEIPFRIEKVTSTGRGHALLHDHILMHRLACGKANSLTRPQ